MYQIKHAREYRPSSLFFAKGPRHSFDRVLGTEQTVVIQLVIKRGKSMVHVWWWKKECKNLVDLYHKMNIFRLYSTCDGATVSLILFIYKYILCVGLILSDRECISRS